MLPTNPLLLSSLSLSLSPSVFAPRYGERRLFFLFFCLPNQIFFSLDFKKENRVSATTWRPCPTMGEEEREFKRKNTNEEEDQASK